MDKSKLIAYPIFLIDFSLSLDKFTRINTNSSNQTVPLDQDRNPTPSLIINKKSPPELLTTTDLLKFKYQDLQAVKILKTTNNKMTCSRCQLIYKQIINDPTKDLTDSRNYRYNSKYALSCLSLPNCNTDNFKYRYSYDKILPENSIGLYEKKVILI